MNESERTMAGAFSSVQISEHVYWVGAIDWELADFHGYATPRGSTYNAFLILADKVTLIDTVKEKYTGELLDRISSVIDPSKIDIIVSNHSEMDHTGALPEIVKVVKPEKIVASPKGVQAISRHFHGTGIEVEAVKEGDTLDLGNMTLRFMLTTMVHWPDSMFSYLEGDGVLFSNDAFGMHLASTERFVDEVDPWVVRYESAKYYANILWPTSKAVSAVLKKVHSLGAPINQIAPDHGPNWRINDDIHLVMDWYRDWTEGKSNPDKAVITFDTMWGSTAKMARAIAEGLGAGGMTVRMLPLQKTERSDLATELLDASVFVAGSPSLNSGLYPTIADALTYIKGLRPSKPTIIGGAFGSYGWSPAVQKQLGEWLTSMGVELPHEVLNTQYVPSGDDLEAAVEYGKALAAARNAD
ncbi:FprA family A-type flavoprotein [bacterium]|nr:FprA family A-type flavoprotein [bacterium]